MTARIRWLALCTLLLGCNVSEPSADQPKPAVRPIFDAESVLAVYRTNNGLLGDGARTIILAAWPDGFIVWSGGRVQGGPPYRAGRVDPKRVSALLARFDTDGLFADENRNHERIGIDAQFNTILVKSGKKQVEMRSWHESWEDNGWWWWVAEDARIADHDDRRRLDVLRKSSADYLFFRFLWSETRSRLADLIPDESTANTGKLIIEADKYYWQEPPASGTRGR
jgi:hypothetical protein